MACAAAKVVDMGAAACCKTAVQQCQQHYRVPGLRSASITSRSSCDTDGDPMLYSAVNSQLRDLVRHCAAGCPADRPAATLHTHTGSLLAGVSKHLLLCKLCCCCDFERTGRRSSPVQLVTAAPRRGIHACSLHSSPASRRSGRSSHQSLQSKPSHDKGGHEQRLRTGASI